MSESDLGLCQNIDKHQSKDKLVSLQMPLKNLGKKGAQLKNFDVIQNVYGGYIECHNYSCDLGFSHKFREMYGGQKVGESLLRFVVNLSIY